MSVELFAAAIIGTAETSLNELLKKDPKTLKQLERLSGKVIRFEIRQPTLHITLVPNSAGMDLLLHSEAIADLVLSGQASDFMQMLYSSSPDEKLFGKGIDVQGDTGLATQFSQMLRDFSIDWEAWLGDIIGDTTAHPLAQFVTQQREYFSKARKSLTDNSVEYLQEELRILPPRPEIEAFMEDIDQLRDDVERLEARINALR